MELKEFLHMKHGDGDLSYSQNQATFTRSTLSSVTKPMLEESIKALLKNQHLMASTDPFTIADLGCATGSASVELLSTAIAIATDVVGSERKTASPVEMLVYLNDLPSNDFNSLFQHMSKFKTRVDAYGQQPLKLVLAGVPGSFHQHLFPTRSLHFVHSSYSAHWLSQAPPELYTGEGCPVNKGNLYISRSSPRRVAEAYRSQFRQDLTAFLSCRAQEVLPDGRVLFTLRGRPSDADANTWQPWELTLLTKAITRSISKGLIHQEKLDWFDMPFYGASPEEIKALVENQLSFVIERMETLKHNVAPGYEHDKRIRSEKLAKIIRSYTESLVAHHFGFEILDPLYDELASVTFEFLEANNSPEHFTIALLLTRSTVG